MSAIEGQISIKLYPKKMLHERVEITSSRPVHAAKILIGKTPEQALALIPLLFNICGVAQSRVALSAIQQALQLEQPAALETARDMLVLSENAKEHLLRVFLDWPTLFGLQNKNHQLPYLSQLVATFKTALFEQSDAFSLNSTLNSDFANAEQAINELETYLHEHVFCCPTEQWLAINSSADLRQWAATTDSIAAVALNNIDQQGWSAQGPSSCPPLPLLDASSLLEQMNASDAAAFIAQPTWQGHCYETTALSRQMQQPLIHLLQQEFDNGLITRWTARLVEIALIPQQMLQLLNTLKNKQHGAPNNTAQLGLAQVEAARGRLIHRVSIKDGRISNYQILAPTEWNFHPQGLIAQSLLHIDTQDKQELDQLTRLMINAIDPCVGYQLSIH